MNTSFEAFSVQHFSALFVFALVTLAVIRRGKVLDETGKANLGLILAGVTCSSLFIESLVKWSEGRYDVLTDLPLFLCDIVALALPFVLYAQNRKWIGIFYFWALAGTLQALITPELDYGFPSFHYFRYFVTHAGIVAAILYIVVIWSVRIGWKDFFQAILYAQVYLLGVHILNTILSSNYSYTLQKPQSATLLDFFGPWPWYILGGEVLMILLFLLLMMPFLIRKPARSPMDTGSGGPVTP